MSKVSVIVPFYNIENYIQECLESVVNQTISDIQVICVNDGSTDNSRDIVRSFVMNDSRFILLEQDNKGVSEARNAGLKYSGIDGDYVYFLDGDDYLFPYSLERMYNVAESQKLDVLRFMATVVCNEPDLNDHFVKYASYYEIKNPYNDVLTGADLMAKMFLNNEYRMSACLYFQRRDHIENNHLRFISGAIHEDNSFTFENLLKAQRATVINECLYNRRIRANSIMTTEQTFRNTRDYFVNYLRMSKVLDAKEGLSPNVLSELQKIVWDVYLKSVLIYDSLSDEERKTDLEKTDTISLKFDYMVRKKVQHINELNNKIMKINDEKAEIKAKLQQTYKEKSEINAKLQQTYKEKSEINSKLQVTYQEKRERGIEIKEQKKLIDEQKHRIDELEKANRIHRNKEEELSVQNFELKNQVNEIYKELSDLRQSKTYRLALVFGKPIRWLRALTRNRRTNIHRGAL